MNKLIIFLLVVCLVSVHGFVRRDVPPATEKNYLEELQKTWESFSKDAGEKAKEIFNPEKMKTVFNTAFDSANKVIEEIRKKVEVSTAAPKA